ncbi:hypothetical protein GLAREA_00797 [Glarea lozoyensis ATCC 20868]|uniref:WLM domain-containing protein n=1 Tax=Glarea lozoyensis (strain ATCC 20868 / MF5171) TaxID=1116229 RepID=S3CT95_GLAL2|nr:uncharacterized protein GLAREA_00797 [Glarea lozoyensis ATCC 20868]EPE29637.1 hypothetical protein GLAREA_00797 [Glarea lozoyensis ATCC 20868]
MVLGWERINSKRSQPNKNIVFIKPLPGATENTAKDYLERIAAQCLPITNKHYLAVASLEEYEPNLEFWGRNFNNGEVIQLVLRSPSTGQWLPFKFVQMVMMHELAHCKEMNHGPKFWKVRNEYASDMKELWQKGYTGDGLWGRGVLLENGAFSQEELGAGEVLPEHMCGGTFKSRGGRKRKAPKPKITYKEQKERRIKKKFGVNGMALGADEQVKVELENGKKPAGKPRVAGSKRGRELRAAAALKRFEVVKEEPSIKDEDLVTDSDTESDNDDPWIKPEPGDAVDINGKRMVDTKGRGMVKVCEDEDKDNEEVQNEMRELASMKAPPPRSPTLMSIPEFNPPVPPTSSTMKASVTSKPRLRATNISSSTATRNESSSSVESKSQNLPQSTHRSPSSPPADTSCPICTSTNTPTSLTCTVCSHVLKLDFVPGSWSCDSEACQGGVYINAGDSGVCGVCGVRK